MFRNPLLIFMVLMLTGRLDAQQKFTTSTYIGINTGGNFCTVSFKPTASQKLMTSASFGLILRHISEPHIGTQVELNYAGRGWIEDRDSVGRYERNLQILDIPVTAAFVAGNRNLRFVFNLGPYFDRLLEERETISIADTSHYQEYYGKKLENQWEFGFTGGLTIEVHTKAGAFGIRAVYSHSLSNLFPLNSDNFYYSASRTQTIHAGITYMIKL